MDPWRDDSAPAGSSDASGVLYRAAHDDSGNAREIAAAADPTTAARSPTSTIYKVPSETACRRQDVVFRVGARLGKIKREELEIASQAVNGNCLKFIRTFEKYIKKNRPDSTQEEVTELFREFFSDNMNFVHRQVLQISALHIFRREVLFAYGAVEKPIGGGYIPSRLIKVLVSDKEEYEILAGVLREERAKNSRDSSLDDEDLQSRTSKETYRTQKTRTVDRDDKKLVLFRASAEEKSSAPSDADSDQKVDMEGLVQRAIGIENNGNQILAQITEPLPMNEREYCSVSVALHSDTVEYAPLQSIPSDCNYRQGNAKSNSQDNVLGSTKENNVSGNAREDDAQDIKGENKSPLFIIAILPLISRSTTRAAEVVSGVSILHHVLAAEEAKPNDAMDTDRDVRINAINKGIRGLFNCRALSLVQVDAVHSHANIIGTRIVTRSNTLAQSTKRQKPA
jgi:hypothetical protein